MVGYKNRQPDIRATEEESGKEESGKTVNPHHLSQNPVHEQKGIKGAEHQ